MISDSFAGLRAPPVPPRHHRRRPNGARLARGGRWSLANRKSAKSDHAQHVERIARALLRRYGVVFMRWREGSWLPRWRELLRVYRKLEARGEIRGGRFASGFSVSVSGADLLNLAGILTPGPKLSALAGNRVLYRDGMPIALLEGDSKFLEVVEPEIESLARLARYGHPANQTAYAIEAVRAAAEKSRRPAVIDGSCPIYDR